MRSPALALGWELWARNRRGLLAVLAWLVVQVIAGLAAVWLDRDGLYPFLHAPLSWTGAVVYLYLLSVFAYAEIVPGGRSRGLPPRLFALPVRTRWLVGLPMLYGSATIFTLMLIDHAAERLHYTHSSLFMFVRWFPWELTFFLIAFLAWVQALSWTVVRAPLLRLAMVVVGLPSTLLAVLFIKLLLNIRWYENQMLWIYCPLIVCAYLFAVAGVALDRRGDRFDGAILGRWLVRALPALPARGWEFGSPAAAQRWLEVRRCAWMLPMVMVLFFVVLLWSALLPFNEADVARSLVAFMWVPAVAGFFIGFSTGKSSFWAADLRLSALTALRPLNCVALARAKIHAAGVSTLLTWAVVLILAPAWALLSGHAWVARALLGAWFHDLPAWELGLLVPVALVGLVGLTWFQIVAGMCLSLTGRIAVVNGVVLLYGTLGATLAGLGIWAEFDPGSFGAVLVILWCLASAISLLKLTALVLVWKRFGSRPDRTMPRLALVWLVVAGCLVVAIETGLPALPVPSTLIALCAVVSLPLTRLIAVPAAVAWNRHR